ncbi:MAG: dihydrolipoamide acetyltransferase family protein [Gemmatimonadales bacterium]|jgi:pyruvate dehydrogenase E2 component (dihydrolipoamide acetyltransferase)
MATKIVMEALSPTMEEGRLVAWKKKEGDAVKAGETLAEVETDKAVMELVARGEGVLRKIVLGEGATVPVGALVAIVGAADEDISKLAGTAARAHGGTEKAPPPRAAAAPAAMPAAVPTAAATPAGAPQMPSRAPVASVPPLPAAPSRTRSSPLARRLARERGIDLTLITGTGPAGRVLKRDVESAGTAARAHGGTEAAAAALPFRAAAASVPLLPAFTDEPLTAMRKAIARRLTQSIGPVPHFFLTTEIDMERAWEAREQLKGLGEAYQISFNDLVVKAVALALRQHPAVNAAFLEDRIRHYGDVHVGMAVAVEDGLITPVIRHADRKGLLEIAAESKLLVERAHARKLQPDEYTGATFTVSNLGMFDIEEFTAVINPPEAAILAVGRIAQRPAVVDGAVQPRRTMRVTMSCDHRAVDGATGAAFLKTLKLMLENPLAMLL